jgi:hypothetical protein
VSIAKTVFFANPMAFVDRVVVVRCDIKDRRDGDKVKSGLESELKLQEAEVLGVAVVIVVANLECLFVV